MCPVVVAESLAREVCYAFFPGNKLELVCFPVVHYAIFREFQLPRFLALVRVDVVGVLLGLAVPVRR